MAYFCLYLGGFVLILMVMENTCLWFLNEVMEGSLIVGNCQKLWFYMGKPFRVGKCEWGRAGTIFEMTAVRPWFFTGKQITALLGFLPTLTGNDKYARVTVSAQ